MMKQETNKNLSEDLTFPKTKLKRSSAGLDVSELNRIQKSDFTFSYPLLLHHVSLALGYLCDLTENTIKGYDEKYQNFIHNQQLRWITLQKNSKGKDVNILYQAFKLEKIAFLVIFILCLVAGSASVVIIYYQQSLAKQIINTKSNSEYNLFGVIIGCIILRFFAFNILMAMTNNVAINIKVGLQNLFMKAIFFLQYNEDEITMNRMRFFAIQNLMQAIIFAPYALVAFLTIIGVIVLVFVLRDKFGFVFFGLFMFYLIIQVIILIIVFRKLRKNESIRNQIDQERKWVFRSFIPLIFDAVADKIVDKIIKNKDKTLTVNSFYNASYSVSQFLADTVCIVSIMVYYGIWNQSHATDLMFMKQTYLSAVYLGMLFAPFKVFVYGCFSIVRGMQQYFTMLDSFKTYFSNKKLKDIHITDSDKTSMHCYPDNITPCLNYENSNDQSLQEVGQTLARSQSQLSQPSFDKTKSNTFIELDSQPGETVMTYFDSSTESKVQMYIKDIVSHLPLQKTVAIINENHFVLPQSFQNNITFYAPYDNLKFKKILELVELDYFLAQIQELGNTQLNYRIAKYYPWHSSRIQLARALYNDVDYLIINKEIIVEDRRLLENIVDYRKKCGKITIIANNWRFGVFELADKIAIFHNNKREVGTYKSLHSNPKSLFNVIKSELKQQGVELKKSENPIQLHESFVSRVSKQAPKIQLKRSIYVQFFDQAHSGGLIVVLLILASPLGFKVYLSFLIGQTFLMNIYTRYILFGVLYLFFVLIRGIMLSFYYRLSSSSIYEKIVKNYHSLRGDQLLSLQKEKDHRIQLDFSKIDRNLVISAELGLSILVQNVLNAIILGIGQPKVLAMAIPILILSFIVNFCYTKIQRKLLLMSDKYEQEYKIFVSHCTTKAAIMFKYGKYRQIQDRFYQLHRKLLVFTCNQMWVLSGMRIIGEIVIIFGVIVFLVIMIETQQGQTTNLAMVSLGVSLYINMNFSYRFNLKTFSIIQSQMLAMTKCISFYKQIGSQAQKIEQKQTNKIGEIQQIEFKDLSIQFYQKQCGCEYLKITKGDRIAISADSKSMAILPFYLLHRKVFGKDHIKGHFQINGKLEEHFQIEGLDFLHYKPLLPYQGTVYDVCKHWKEEITVDECTKNLQSFLKEISAENIFTLTTPLKDLNIAHQQLLSVFRSIFIAKSKIIVLVSPLDYLDILTRIRVEKYLIECRDINILISLTNINEVISLYKRHLHFQEGKYAEIKSQK